MLPPNAPQSRLRWLSTVVAIGGVLVVACVAPIQQDSPTEPERREASDGRYVEIAGVRYLRAGVRVGPGEELDAPVEPFDRRRHRTVPFRLAGKNMAGNPGFVLPPRTRTGVSARNIESRLQFTPPPPGTGDYGLTLTDSSKAWQGVYQVHDAGLTVELPLRTQQQGSAFVYAPTLLPPGGSCVEVTTIHLRQPGLGETTEHWQGWYDWCNSDSTGAFAMLVEMDSEFQDLYIRTQ